LKITIAANFSGIFARKSSEFILAVFLAV